MAVPVSVVQQELPAKVADSKSTEGFHIKDYSHTLDIKDTLQEQMKLEGEAGRRVVCFKTVNAQHKDVLPRQNDCEILTTAAEMMLASAKTP